MSNLLDNFSIKAKSIKTQICQSFSTVSLTLSYVKKNKKYIA